jgi:hypothetical protein
MNPELAWRSERENIDHLLARMASDPDFRRQVGSDPAAAIGDFSGAPLERHMARCGPLKTSCPPGKTCAKKSCKKTLITVI